MLIAACVICGSGATTLFAAQSSDGIPKATDPVQQVLTVKKTPAKVVLSNLNQVYDGNPKSVEATTEPAGLTVSFTYNGSVKAPTEAGRYRVVATIQDASYEGSTVGRMIIAKAPQKISFKLPDARIFGDADFPLGAIPSSDLPLTVKSSNAKVAAIVNGQIHVVSAGTATITVSQAGNGNYLAAKPVSKALIVKKAPAKVILSGLEQTYDGKMRPVNAATEPAGLTVRIAYDKKAKPPVNAGSYQVVATVLDYNYEGSATGTLIVAKAPQSITFNPLPARIYGDRPFRLSSTASSGLVPAYESSDPKVAIISGNQVKIVGAGTATITVSQAGDSNYQAAAPSQQTLVVNKAPATVVLNNLNQTYDGTPRSAGASTSPAGIVVSLTYDGKDAPPVDAGSYTVEARVRDSKYQGSTTGTLIVAKVSQNIIFSTLSVRTYGDKPFHLSSTASSGLVPAYESSDPKVAIISGDEVTIVGAGTAMITASQAGDANHMAAELVQQPLSVKKANAKVTLNNLEYTYDGTPKPIAVVTEPSGLAIRITYDGSATAPVNAGSYTVVATVDDANYDGSATGTLAIAKAPQSITFNTLKMTTYGDTDFPFGATTSSGLPLSGTSSDISVAAIINGQIHIVGAGTATITVSQVGDRNYLAAEPVWQVLTVKKAPAKVVLGNLNQVYEGNPRSVEATTEPAGLTVSFTYDGSTSAPTGVGQYTVVATIQDANYEGSAVGSMTIAKAPQKISFKPLDARTFGDADFPPGAISSSGLLLAVESSNAKIAAIINGQIHIVGAGNTTITVSQAGDGNYLAAEAVRQVLIVKKAPQIITFNPLESRFYDDETPYMLFATITSGLTATYSSSDLSVAVVNGNQVKIKGAGSTTITAYQSGDTNFLAAEPVQQVLTVKKRNAWIVLRGLDQIYTYDGAPKPALATTSPEGLTVKITYNGVNQVPIDGGRYTVKAVIEDARYEGTATGTLTIARVSQSITFPALAPRTVGNQPFELIATLSSGLTASYQSSDPSVATIIGKQVTITGAGSTLITAFQTGDHNYEAAEPVTRTLIIRSRKPRIVVFPIENLSGNPVPLKEIRKTLIQGLINQGASVLDEEDLERFLARHRIRYTSGVDMVTAQAWKKEAGIEAILITSVDQYQDSEVPKIAITSRLVATGEPPYILWMESFGMSGDDSPGLFGMGLIEQIGVLQDHAVKRLLGSLASFYADKIEPDKVLAPKTFEPKTAFEVPFLVPGKTYSVAVMPFFNQTKNSKAGEIIALRFVNQLVKNKMFVVLEPGVVRQKFLNYRIIMHDGLSKAQADSFFNNLGTDLIFAGRVMKYDEGAFSIEFNTQVYARDSRAMVWSSWSHNQGYDAVFVFDWRRVNNAGALASMMVQSVIRDMTMNNEIK
jgi:MBG domain-containing protein